MWMKKTTNDPTNVLQSTKMYSLQQYPGVHYNTLCQAPNLPKTDVNKLSKNS